MIYGHALTHEHGLPQNLENLGKPSRYEDLANTSLGHSQRAMKTKGPERPNSEIAFSGIGGSSNLPIPPDFAVSSLKPLIRWWG